MEHGRVVMTIMSNSLLFLIALPFIIRLVRQFIAIKLGRKYLSDRVHSDNCGRLFVEWTDDNGEKRRKVFSVIDRNYRSLTEVTIYCYKKMLSLGKISVLDDIFLILTVLAAIIFLSVYARINL